ncbi:hypothetical protein [Phenylobacterium sp.]|uniref:hypothetical protein n=1 Tax=Phenylobacterium sp. TaxID=1871053 RepID=UPI0035B04B1E
MLLAYYQARTGVGASQFAAQAAAGSAANQKKVPTAPWSTLSKSPQPDDLMKGVLNGHKFVDENAAKIDVKDANSDYKKLFSVYQALATLNALAEKANSSDTSAAELKRIQAAFTRGMSEVSSYLDTAKFDEFRLTQGDMTTQARMSVGVPKTNATYVTAPLQAGSADDAVDAFQGNVSFNLAVKSLANVTTNVTFDLSEMGSTTRSMNNVVKYMNDKLAAAGVYTRVTVDRIAGQDQTTTVNGKTITLSKAVDQFALKIQGDTTEQLTFSANTTAPAVYVTQTVGDPDPDGKPSTNDAVQNEQLLKLETGTASDAVRRPGDVNWVDGRVFAVDLPSEVTSVRKTVTGADGSIYMLADVNGEVDGQTIKGQSDVALMKYDSAGKLIYTRTLGAASNADGFGLAVSADGQIAISGSVTGGLIRGETGADPTTADSFVTVFDDQGQEVWTQRQGARDEDEATSVAWGADGTLYVAGRTKSALSGQSASGGWDGYLRSYNTNGTLVSTNQFGTSGDDKMAGLVVDGNNVIVATQEGGDAKLRQFDFTTANAPTLAATRDLGSLGGGSLAGVALDGSKVVLAGSSGGVLSVGTTTRAYSGDIDAFAATVSTDLSSTASDAIAYYGGSGSEHATAVTVSGGKVWIAGTSKGDIGGAAPIGDVDGFVAELDVATGAVGYSQRFSGKDGFATPNTITVGQTGSSVLDRLGLPEGTINYKDSQLITAATAARDGDSFQIRTRIGGPAVTISISNDDTLDTLAQKIRRVTGYTVKVDVVSDVDSRKLQIKPINDRYSLEILGGTGGKDALEALGLQEGFVRATTIDKKTDKIVPADGGSPMYALKLPRDVSLNSDTDVKNALDKLSLAMSAVRTAYRDLQSAATPKDPLANVKGTAPAYLTAQIANYQAGLDRLTGGG